MSPSDNAPAVTPITGVVDALVPSVVSLQSNTGAGSGVIYSADGLVVTNNHVVAGNEIVAVSFVDGTSSEGRVLATDPATDLAVVRVERKNLPAARFQSELPRVGELAVAVGNPLGFDSTATAGIVSGLGRTLPTGRGNEVLVDLLQTDAAISPGNSGGALANAQSAVIGVNVAYVPPQAGAVAIGFAIPSYVVIDVVDELLRTGKADHPYLGIAAQPITPRIADQYDIEVDSGAVILSVSANSPAAQADLRAGDVVVRLADEPIRDLDDLFSAVHRHDVGNEVQITFMRNGEQRTATVKLAERPSQSP